MSDFKTFVFFDTETTGLPQFENYTTRITELCMVAVEADHIRKGAFPRVLHKLILCFNPEKAISEKAAEMTGLSNTLLEHQSTFSANTVDMINAFLSHSSQPVCLVAHNGHKFDYPLLQKEIRTSEKPLKGNVYCIDSIDMFKYYHETENEKSSAETPKRLKTGYTTGVRFRLCDVYQRILGKEMEDAHNAEADTTALLTCAAKIGDDFVDWANKNALQLSDIPPMTSRTSF